ncbi:MAG: hypothetical protein LBQ30_05420 [Treponema sp.]|nr:hypothetical protein [Treponema sp.]
MKDTGMAPDRLQVRLTEEERKQLYVAWKELDPHVDWASFCRKMLKKGVELARIDNQAIKANRNRWFNEKVIHKEDLIGIWHAAYLDDPIDAPITINHQLIFTDDMLASMVTRDDRAETNSASWSLLAIGPGYALTYGGSTYEIALAGETLLIKFPRRMVTFTRSDAEARENETGSRDQPGPF